jgi:imidazole glycerol phosphate synthase subunit HisF
MTTQNKDFKVKHGLDVANGGTFGGPVSVGDPVELTHAVNKQYIDSLLALAGLGTFDGGNAGTTEWGYQLDGGGAAV